MAAADRSQVSSSGNGELRSAKVPNGGVSELMPQIFCDGYVPQAVNIRGTESNRFSSQVFQIPPEINSSYEIHGNFATSTRDAYAYNPSFPSPPPGFSSHQLPCVRPIPYVNSHMSQQSSFPATGRAKVGTEAYSSASRVCENQIPGIVNQAGFEFHHFMPSGAQEQRLNPFLVESTSDNRVLHVKSRSPGLEDRSAQFGEKHTGAGTLDKPQANVPIIGPMIDNIVGSMNGTYTHFGGTQRPLPTPTNGNYEPSQWVTGASRTAIGDVVVSDARFSNSASGFRKELDNSGLGNSSLPLMDNVGANNSNSINQAYATVTKSFNEVSSAFKTNGGQQRSVTPKDGLDSRPQTPGKRSYSEVLARNEPKVASSNQVSQKSTTFSNPPSPGMSAMMNSVATSSRRSSSSSLNFVEGNKDQSAYSNGSSASSSPVVPPKNLQGENHKRNLKGKENNSNPSSKSSTTKNTPTNSPHHSTVTNSACQQASSGKSGRKILNTNSQNSQAQVNATSKTAPRVVSKSRSFPFDFDINDVDDEDSLMDGSFMEYRGRRSGTTESDLKHLSSSTTGIKSRNADDEVCGSPKHPVGSIVSNGHSMSSGSDKKSGSGLLIGVSGVSKSTRSHRDKSDRARQKKGGRHCNVQRLKALASTWAFHLLAAIYWLWSLVLNVGALSCSLALNLLQDFCIWWKHSAVPSFHLKIKVGTAKMKQGWVKLKSKFWLGSIAAPDSDGPQESPYIPKGQQAEILSVMGPEKNISLPGSGEEALKRLLSVKGQDPYSILGIRSDSSDDTVKRYYKKQAVLVHPDKNVVPGAEEGFKILQRAFELVGDPVNRLEYHRQILEANEKKRVTRELEALLEQLRKKMESVSNSIRCTKCNSRHKKNRTDRPLFAARYCAQCRIHHAAREGDLWAEKRGFFGLSRQFFACMEGCVWEINEWASCQKKNLKHLLPDSHNIMYRLVAGGKGCNGSGTPGGNQNCGNGRYGKSSKWENSASSHFHPYGEPMSDTGLGSGTTIDDWHTIVNNLCRSPHGPGSCPPSQNSSHSQCSSYSSKPHSQNGSSATPNAHGSGNRMFDGSVFNMMNGMMGTSNSSANSHCGKTCMDSTGSSRKRSKVKRK